MFGAEPVVGISTVTRTQRKDTLPYICPGRVFKQLLMLANLLILEVGNQRENSIYKPLFLTDVKHKELLCFQVVHLPSVSPVSWAAEPTFCHILQGTLPACQQFLASFCSPPGTELCFSQLNPGIQQHSFLSAPVCTHSFSK